LKRGLITWIGQGPNDGDPAMKILALDLGKSKMVGCVYDTETCEARYDSCPLEPRTVRTALESEQPDRVVIEIGPTAGWVGDVVRESGVELEVANPTHDAWRWRNVKRKTDRLDALKLAQLSAARQLPLVHLPQRRVRQWRSLIQYRHRIVGRRTRVKNRIRGLLTVEGLPAAAGQKFWTQDGLKKLRAMARPMEEVDVDDLWRGQLGEELQQFDELTACLRRVEARLDALAGEDPRVARLRTIPGVGPRLAEAVVALVDDPHRFKRGKQVAAYLGLVPRQYQSGTMDRAGRITGQGNRQVRGLLIEVSWLGLRHNRWMRETYQRLHRDRPRRRKTAIVGVARRLVIRCWAMLRDQTDWSPPQPVKVCSGLGEPVRRRGLRPTLSTVAHSLRSIRASDGRQGPEPQALKLDTVERSR
jgi:transposase